MHFSFRFIGVLALGLMLSPAGQSQTPAAASTPVAEIAPPAHPATVDQIKEYMALTHYVENAHKAMAQMLNASRATSAPYLTPSFWDDMGTSIAALDLVTPTIPAYQKYFSQEDMAATIAFYQSPAGQKFLAAQPYIAAAAGEVLRASGQRAGQEVFARHKDEIEAMKKKSEQAPASATPAQK